jgi:hypothetical protein
MHQFMGFFGHGKRCGQGEIINLSEPDLLQGRHNPSGRHASGRKAKILGNGAAHCGPALSQQETLWIRQGFIDCRNETMVVGGKQRLRKT